MCADTQNERVSPIPRGHWAALKETGKQLTVELESVEGSSFVAVHLITGKMIKQHMLPSNNNSIFYSGNKASEGKKL